LSQNPSIQIGSIVRLRTRLWRVDNIYSDTLEATPIEGTHQMARRFFIPLENISPGRLEIPSAEKVGNFSSQQLMVRAFRLSMIHGTAPLLSLQRSRVIAETFQLVPVVISLEMPEPEPPPLVGLLC